MKAEKLYAKRDIRGLAEFYTKHVMAMTAEKLHYKHDIAGELAYRDSEIARLKAQIKDILP